MSLPRVAIVGRPNVGKSSIMNLLAKAKVSIVDPTPGVTRDRISTIVELDDPDAKAEPRLVEIVDTGGYGVYTAEGARFDDAGMDLSNLTDDIEFQIASAVRDADMILFVIDAQSGITSLDETVARLLRESLRKADPNNPTPITVVANKVDSMKWEAHAFEAANLGFGEPLMLSAKSNYFRRDFIDALYRTVPEPTQHDESTKPAEMKICLVGRRNAGKSSMVNALAGEQRVIVSEIAGTTRDAVDVRFEMDGHTYMVIDTAGVRKRTKFADAVELFAFQRFQASIRRADISCLLIDATENISGIDKRLGKLCVEQFKPTVIVVTKWDLVEGRKNRKGQLVTVDDYEKYITKELPGLSRAPIVFTSSTDRVGLEQVIEAAFDLYKQARKRVSTSKLNKAVEEIIASRGPSGRLGTQAKVFYASQVASNPPTIVLVVNKKELFEGQYEKFLLNRLHEHLPFEEVPIRLLFRERNRAKLNDLLSGRHRRSKQAAAHTPGLIDESGADIPLDDTDDE